jgi:lysophospholipase L1-like esterase
MIRPQWCTSILAAICLGAAAFAQQPAPKQSGLERWRASRAEIYMNDFGELARYRDENARLKPPAPGEKRGVFFGDSITDFWPLAEYFPGRPYINRGIGGQTTPQMLVRFRQDVIALQPRVVVILAGTNDIAGNTGPMRLEDIEANYASLAELAGANGIKVVFSSVLPVHNYTTQSQELFAGRPPEKILALNRWLSAYSAAHGCIYLDYYDSMVDAHGLLRQELAQDGLHPNEEGYKIMASLAEAAIHTALGEAAVNAK